MENNNDLNSDSTNKKFNKFPLTKYFYRKGLDRWNETIDHEEQVGYCGPPDRPCIDCYLCFTPICSVFDLLTLCSFQCIKI